MDNERRQRRDDRDGHGLECHLPPPPPPPPGWTIIYCVFAAMANMKNGTA